MNAKSFFKEVAFYAASPAAMLTSYFLTPTLLVGLISATAILITTIVILMVTKKPGYFISDAARKQMSVLLAMDTWGIICFLYLKYISIEFNPLNHFWQIVISIAVITGVICSIVVYRNKETVLIISRALQVANAAVLLVAIYLLFGSYTIFLPTLFGFIGYMLVAWCYSSWIDSDESSILSVVLFSAIISIISSFVYKFWSVKIWEYNFIGAVVFGILFVAIYKIVQRERRKKAKKIQDKATAELNTLQAEERQRKSEARTTLEKEEREGKVRKAEAMFEEMKAAKEVDWKDLSFVLKHVPELEGNLPYDVMLKADIRKLVKHSTIKNQISFPETDISAALSWHNWLFKTCFDGDDIIQKFVSDIEGLSVFNTYTGYKALLTFITDKEKYPFVNAIVRMKQPDSESKLLEE